jgi:sugar phosphate permease
MRNLTPAERQELGEHALPVPHHAIAWEEALRSTALWRIAAIGACYVYVLAFFQSWLQTYLVKGRGFTETELRFSTLTYLVGALANLGGGLLSDGLAARFGLKTGRRTVGVAGLGAAAIFMAAAILTRSGAWVLVFLTLVYGAILFQQPSLCSLCLDTGKTKAGAVFGFVNTLANAASALSSVAFGYVVTYSGSYEAPFLPMLAALLLGSVLWLKVDPTRQLFEERPARASGPIAAPTLPFGAGDP